MKTYDRHEVKRNEIYYMIGSMDAPTSITKIKCRKTIPSKYKWLYGAKFFHTFSFHLTPHEIRQTIFRKFDKAKAICIKRAKKIKRKANLELSRLENLTWKDLIIEKSNGQ